MREADIQEEVFNTFAPAAFSNGDTSGADLHGAELAAIKASYERHISCNSALLDDVVFILTQRIAETGVKIHSVEHYNQCIDLRYSEMSA